MESDLLAALKEEYGDNPEEAATHHLAFAVSNRQRAADIIKKIEQKVGLDLRRRQVLDVGSAYGGFVIVAAQRGARAWGVEVSPRFYRYGELNAKGETGEINLVLGDFLSPQVMSQLPRGFDLALCNCLFEHVRDTCCLLRNLHLLLGEGGLVVFQIPNGEAIQMLEKEEHRFQPGLTLLPPERWQEANGIYYRPWTYYEGLFNAFGFRWVEKWNAQPQMSFRRMTEDVTAGLARAERAIQGSTYEDDLRSAMLAGLQDLRARVARDAERQDAEAFYWDYLVPYWEGCAVKIGPLAGGLPLTSPRAEAPDVPRKVTFVEPASQYAGRWQQRTRSVALSLAGDGLHCEIVGMPDSSGGQYGGIKFPAAPFRALSLEVTFLQPENIEAVYVDACRASGVCALRWEWRVTGERWPSARRSSYLLVPGMPSGHFVPAEQCDSAPVEDIELFIRIRPGSQAGFVLHKAEVVPLREREG